MAGESHSDRQVTRSSFSATLVEHHYELRVRHGQHGHIKRIKRLKGTKTYMFMRMKMMNLRTDLAEISLAVAFFPCKIKKYR
uniref:Uncharacterized protein n=1 Tax=Arundo donax TaxID=35708 RepID=A0A0A9DE09_ARUDO